MSLPSADTFLTVAVLALMFVVLMSLRCWFAVGY